MDAYEIWGLFSAFDDRSNSMPWTRQQDEVVLLLYLVTVKMTSIDELTCSSVYRVAAVLGMRPKSQAEYY